MLDPKTLRQYIVGMRGNVDLGLAQDRGLTLVGALEYYKKYSLVVADAGIQIDNPRYN